MTNECVVKNLKMLEMKLSTMESCTSGALINKITNVEGASEITEGGYVTYSNNAKIRMGVPKEVIEKYGVYSIETAIAMAKACKSLNDCSIGIGVTGTFSNVDPNNNDSLPGIVYYAIIINDKCHEFKTSVKMYSSRESQKDCLSDEILYNLNNILTAE